MRPKNLMRGLVGLAALALTSAPAPAVACPVCFGMLEGPLADGTNKAILTLLGITGCVLAGFATFFIYLIRRARIPAETAVRGEALRGVPVCEGAAGQVMEETAS
jgi:hypothetical protein